MLFLPLSVYNTYTLNSQNRKIIFYKNARMFTITTFDLPFGFVGFEIVHAVKCMSRIIVVINMEYKNICYIR